MTNKKPTLKLKLSGAALLKLQSKIPKPKKLAPKPSEVFTEKSNKVSDNKKSKKAIAKKTSVQKVKEQVLKSKTKKEEITASPFNLNQYFLLLNQLQRANYRSFPPKNKPAKPLARGIHKEIAKVYGMSNRKAYYFCRTYCGTKRYKDACVTGAIRRTLKGKNGGIVE